MTGLQEIVYIGEVVLQAKIAKRAGERLLAASENSDHVDVWMSIQSILVAAGNVSKILWPGKANKQRGERLRLLLKVDAVSLLSDRKFRNHFEHYDERIGDWFKNQSSAVYSDLAMNPILRGSAPISHRGYNSLTNTLQFRGELLDLNEVLKALEDICNSCKLYTVV